MMSENKIINTKDFGLWVKERQAGLNLELQSETRLGLDWPSCMRLHGQRPE